jgi:hypothetical protein
MFLVIWPILVCEIGHFSNTLKIKHFERSRRTSMHKHVLTHMKIPICRKVKCKGYKNNIIEQKVIRELGHTWYLHGHVLSFE